jgi:hypothetical protein
MNYFCACAPNPQLVCVAKALYFQWHRELFYYFIFAGHNISYKIGDVVHNCATLFGLLALFSKLLA